MRHSGRNKHIGQSPRLPWTIPFFCDISTGVQQRVLDATRGLVVQDRSVHGTDGRVFLVVDDDEDLRQALVDILELECGQLCRVLSAGDPREAKALVVRERGDLLWKVLSDIDMPGESGLSLCTWIHERFAHVELAIMTGLPSEERAEIARRIPARFFTKPVDLQVLIDWSRTTTIH